MGRFVRRLAPFIALAMPMATMPHASATTTCAVHHVDVGHGLTIRTELCTPYGATTVHILSTPAATNHTYWDPGLPAYSYRRVLNSAGLATLTVDPLGSIYSSQPLSARVTIAGYVRHVHLLVGALRAGTLGGHAFRHVIANGFSNSALVSVMEAAKYHDVDALVLTGLSSPINAPNLVMSGQDGELATSDRRFAHYPLDPGYIAFGDNFYTHTLTSPNGYNADALDALVAGKDTWTSEYATGIFEDAARALVEPLTSPARKIDVPVLVAVGSADQLMCGSGATDCTNADTVRASNAPYYRNSPRLETFVLPGAGHAMHFARNAADWFNYAAVWSQAVVPT